MTVIKPAPIRKRLVVNASIENAFDAFFDRMNDWSPRQHSLTGGLRKSLIVEPFPGGRWYEVGENGVECDWGVVVEWQPPRRALLLWQIGSDFSFNPNVRTEIEVAFHPQLHGGTEVIFEHRLLEQLGGDGETTREALDGDDGWGGALLAYTALFNGDRE